MGKLTYRIIVLVCTAVMIPAFSADYKVIHNFGSGNDGQLPSGPVAIGKGGVLYGTTQYGGNGPSCVFGYQGCGTVFSLTPPGSAGGPWSETVLYNFTGGTDGGVSTEGLAVADNGVIYGAAARGGDAACSFDGGAVSSVVTHVTADPDVFTVPAITVTFGNAPNNIYADVLGRLPLRIHRKHGTNGCGVIFALTPPASPGDPWEENVLHTFTGADGASPNSITLDGNGVLYGTTFGGGSNSCTYVPDLGCGMAYSLSPPSSPGGEWTFQLLARFTGVSGPSNPAAGLLISGGVLYGTSENGGNPSYAGLGTVFSLVPPISIHDPWEVVMLHSFNHPESDGANPSGALVMDGNGVLYGTTQNGGFGECSATGVSGCGTVFTLSRPSLSDPYNETLIYSFNSFGFCSNGSTAYAGVILGNNGVLYGTTDCGSEKSPGGEIYSLTPPISPNTAWSETTLHHFANSANGAVPYDNLVMAKDGALYGTTYFGGANGVGTIFSLKP